MGALEELYSDANQAPQPLWQLRSWEAGEERLGERELAIRTKAQELANRNNKVDGTIGQICEVLGVVKAPGSSWEDEYPTRDIRLPSNPETHRKLFATIGRARGDHSAWVKYYEISPGDERREIPRTARHHTSVFDADDTTALRLELQYGTFTWVNDNVDYDNSRVEILEDAEGVVSAWEGITTMLSQAIRDHELNPEFAAAMAEKDAAARERAENYERIAAFLAGRRSVAD